MNREKSAKPALNTIQSGGSKKICKFKPLWKNPQGFLYFLKPSLKKDVFCFCPDSTEKTAIGKIAVSDVFPKANNLKYVQFVKFQFQEVGN